MVEATYLTDALGEGNYYRLSSVGTITKDAELDVLNFLRTYCQGKTLDYVARFRRGGLHVYKRCVILSSVAFDVSHNDVSVEYAALPLNTRGLLPDRQT